MPTFSAHIGYLFGEVPLADRFAAAGAAGFAAVEHPDPYALGVECFATLATENGLAVAQIAAPAGDAARGEKGLACLPGRAEDFRASVEQGIAAAVAIGTRHLHVMPGLVPAGMTRDRLRGTWLANSDWAAGRAAAAGLTVLVEAISDETVPGFYVNDPAFAIELIAQLGRGNVRLLFDTFHAAVKGHDILRFAEDHIDLIGHVHVADHPGRHQPGTGTLDFDGFFRLLDRLGYSGRVGLEYKPLGTSGDSLGWLQSVAG